MAARAASPPRRRSGQGRADEGRDDPPPALASVGRRGRHRAARRAAEAAAPIGARLRSVVRRGGCAGDGARATAHRGANRRARGAPNRKRHDTPDGRADTSARRPARQGARARIRVPTPIPIVISTVIVRVGAPVHMLVTLVGVIPIGIVIGDRRVRPVSIPPVHPPAIAVLIAGNISPFNCIGARDGRYHRASAHQGENRTQSERSSKDFHGIVFLGNRAAGPPTVPSATNEAERPWFQPWMAQNAGTSRLRASP
jgi:hypothetical protein